MQDTKQERDESVFNRCFMDRHMNREIETQRNISGAETV